jgi:hypothetical protein
VLITGENVKLESFIPKNPPVRKTENMTGKNLAVFYESQNHEVFNSIGVVDAEVGLNNANCRFHISYGNVETFGKVKLVWES